MAEQSGERPAEIPDLVVVLPGGAERAVRGELVLGRTDLAEASVGDALSRVSARHAHIFRDTGGYWVEDGVDGRPSRNGTRLNGREIKGLGPQRLQPGDVLELANAARISVIASSGPQPGGPLRVAAAGATVLSPPRPKAVVVAPPSPLVSRTEATVGIPPSPSKAEAEASSRLLAAMHRFARLDLDPLQKGIERIFDLHRKVRPAFSSSWVIPRPPEDGELITQYDVDGTAVRLFSIPGEMDNLYFFVPDEYRLSIPHLRLLDEAKKELINHRPSGLDIERPEDVRRYVEQLGQRIIPQTARRLGLTLGGSRREEAEAIERFAKVLAKYTAGFGIAETFLSDERINDVYVDAPASSNPVHLTIAGMGDERIRGRCRTNITLGEEDAESLLARFRYDSGRPFSEAFPILEHNLDAHDTRVTVIGRPLSPAGVAMALRKHSTAPWTLPRLIAAKSLTATAAGLLSFLIDGKSTILVAGSRGAGKSSLLGAIMLEFPLSQRILTIEDTLELPTRVMQQLGYKVQSMAVQSSLGGRGEVTADEALRVSLRLGESAIVLGEVRGQEARTLYEAMRAGTAGSSVLGTFHADSAKAVFERVVHDMGIPPKSFGATDIVVIAGVGRPGGVLREVRRVLQVAELVKSSGVDGHFQDLMTYDAQGDSLTETDVMKYSSEKIGGIARSWGFTMEEAIQNIEVRGAYRQKMVDFAREHNRPVVLGAEWVARSNSTFWTLLEKQQGERAGQKPDYAALLADWTAWFERAAKYA